MDRSYREIREKISQQTQAFPEFLKVFVFDDESWSLLEQISTDSKTYIFSGVIRNYLIGEPLSRDLDLVVEDISKIHIPQELIDNQKLKINSFGGYKLSLDRLDIDIWELRNTWSIKRNPSLKPTPHTLIKTAFFNYSAIVYDMREKRFIYGDDFLSFYDKSIMDIVNPENPDPKLCIISTMHNALKYCMPIGTKLCKWITSKSFEGDSYAETQLRHYGKIIYSDDVVRKFCSVCKTFVNNYKKDSNNALFLENVKILRNGNI